MLDFTVDQCSFREVNWHINHQSISVAVSTRVFTSVAAKLRRISCGGRIFAIPFSGMRWERGIRSIPVGTPENVFWSQHVDIAGSRRLCQGTVFQKLPKKGKVEYDFRSSNWSLHTLIVKLIYPRTFPETQFSPKQSFLCIIALRWLSRKCIFTSYSLETCFAKIQ